MAKLSDQAEYYLSYFVNNPHVRINATTIMTKFKQSRRRSRAIIQELEAAKCLVRERSIGNGTVLKLANPEGTKIVPWVTAIRQYSHSAGTAIVPIAVQLEMTNIATNKFLDEVKEEDKSMGYEFFGATSGDDPDLLRAREKHEAKKKAEYQAKREKKAEARDLRHRSKVDPMQWTCKDVAYEFSTRLQDFWEIPPMSVTQTRFVQALATFRRQHDTNGAIELELVKMFFENLRSEKINDGNHAWRTFMFKAPMMLQTARERVVTPEQIETAIIDDTARANRKLALFDEDDDV